LFCVLISRVVIQVARIYTIKFLTLDVCCHIHDENIGTAEFGYQKLILEREK